MLAANSSTTIQSNFFQLSHETWKQETKSKRQKARDKKQETKSKRQLLSSPSTHVNPNTVAASLFMASVFCKKSLDALLASGKAGDRIYEMTSVG
jgi:hypothetical protein